MESVSTRNIDVNVNENKKNEISSYGNTLVEAFRNTVSKYAEKPVLHYKKNDKWEHYTFTQTHEICMQVAKAITHLNIPVKSAVNIIGFNSCEWFFSAVGALIAGDVITGVYATNNSSVCEYVVDNSSASLVICDGIKQLQKYIPIVEKLKALVVYNVETIPEDIKSKVKIPIYTFNEFIEIGKDISIDKVNERTNQIKPSDLCSLIYTSGTTGNPKGVMLSHENILSTVDTVISDIDGVTNDDCLVSYLPLSHVAAQLLDIHAPICVGLQVYIADPDALRGTLGATIKEAKPTIFFGVPRVYEKIMEKMVSASEKMHGIKKRLAEWSASKGLQKARLQEYGKSGGAPCGYGCANALVLSKVREILGFQNARFMITSAAPIRPEVIDFFASYGLYLYELYGESETCGPISYNIPGKWKIGSVGRGMRSMDIKIDPNTSELLCKGRNIMMGYFKNEKATKETIDENGYLHTGDIASIDEDGFLHITGRIKELIITAGGENIGPGSIEDSIKEALPELANAMLIGDHRKYLTVLFTFATELDEQGAPTSKLTEKTLNDCKRLGSKATTIEELKKCEIWKKHLDEGLKKANENAASRACTVQKYTILDRDFSVSTEELTPTLKVRRSIIAKKYKDAIEKMYAEEKK